MSSKSKQKNVTKIQKTNQITPEEMHEINTNAIKSIKNNLYTPENYCKVLSDVRAVYGQDKIGVNIVYSVLNFIKEKLDELEKVFKNVKLGDKNDMDKVVKIACKLPQEITCETNTYDGSHVYSLKEKDIAKMYCANQILKPSIDEFLRISALKIGDEN